MRRLASHTRPTATPAMGSPSAVAPRPKSMMLRPRIASAIDAAKIKVSSATMVALDTLRVTAR